MSYFNKLDIVEAHYSFCNDFHSGQWSDLYARSCRIGEYYSPSPMFNGFESLSDNAKEIYLDLMRKNDLKNDQEFLFESAKFTVAFCYDSVTHEESNPDDIDPAEYSTDNGYYSPGGWLYSLQDKEIAEDIDANPADYHEIGTIEDHLYDAENLGIYEPSNSDIGDRTWFSSDHTWDHNLDCEIGYSIHFQDLAETLTFYCSALTVQEFLQAFYERLKGS